MFLRFQNARYYLDSGDGTRADQFQSLDDLVVFGMAHELKVAGEEVHLNDAVACRNVASPHLLTPLCGGIPCNTLMPHSPHMLPICRTGQRGRLPEREDNDLLTDLFASVFGAHCAVSHITTFIHSQCARPDSLLGSGGSAQQPEV